MVFTCVSSWVDMAHKEDGLTLKMIIKQWTKVIWNVYGMCLKG